MLLSVVFTSTVSFVHLSRNTTGQLSPIDNVKIEESGLINGSLKLYSANLVCGPLNLLIMTEFSFSSSCIEYLLWRISMTARNGSGISLLQLVHVDCGFCQNLAFTWCHFSQNRCSCLGTGSFLNAHRSLESFPRTLVCV